MRKWIARRAGRRGAFLAFLAILDWCVGFSLYATEAPQRLQDLWLPWQAWGIIWLVMGCICASGVFVRHDRIQFALSAMFKVAWGLLYLNVWLVQDVPRGWVSVVIWLSFAATVFLISGWPEPVREDRP